MQMGSIPIIDAFPTLFAYQHVGIPASVLADSQYAADKTQLINELSIKINQIVTSLIRGNTKETIEANDTVINSWQRQLTVIWVSQITTIHPS